VAEETAQLLKARGGGEDARESTLRTMVGPAENNPLKFLPTAEEILDAMLARRRQGYLDAKRSFEEAFRDLKAHEIATYSAMQSALGLARRSVS
jgi:type VI secretion system protein ImpI